MCILTHDRTYGPSSYRFFEGELYNAEYDINIICHPLCKFGFIYSDEFFKRRFVIIAEHREKQINSILND